MAELARHTRLPLATNMVVTTAGGVPAERREKAVQVILSDHHYWGGLRATQQLARMCDLWGLGISMHSNSHLGISLMAMTHVAAAIPNLAYACDTHYPWQDEDLVRGGRIAFSEGAVRVPTRPGSASSWTAKRSRDCTTSTCPAASATGTTASRCRKYDPSFTGAAPRY
jgi:glucarate dehydratase